MTEREKNILLVEDSAAMRSFITSVLENYFDNISVYEAENGFTALKLLPLHAFSLIITDINMPDINGLELIRYIKENPNYEKIPILIISTESSDEDRKRGLALGAERYLNKPFSPSALNDAVKPFLIKDKTDDD